jgi:hypothetical protein
MEAGRVVSEDIAICVISEVFRELHEALGVIEDAAREGEATSNKGCETTVVQRNLVAL